MNEVDIKKTCELMKVMGIGLWLTDVQLLTQSYFGKIFGLDFNFVSRPFFVFIFKKGRQIILCHSIDLEFIQASNYELITYGSRNDLELSLKKIISSENSDNIALNYSPKYRINNFDMTNSGFVELVKSISNSIVSSSELIVRCTETWTVEELKSHIEAGKVLHSAIHSAYKFIQENIHWRLSETDVADYIRGICGRNGVDIEQGPIVAFNENSALPHYIPRPETAKSITKNGWLMIDLWGKFKQKEAIYSDITWVSALGNIQNKQLEIFKVVKESQNLVLEMIEKGYETGIFPTGYELDALARQHITQAGYGKYFTHRLGHSIKYQVHSAGINLDSYESHDKRRLIPETGFSIEPGIYIPNNFGLRLEMNVYLAKDGYKITTQRQEQLVLIET